MRILFLIPSKDRSYTSFIKPNIPSWATGGKVLVDVKLDYLSELDYLAKSHNCDAIATSDYQVLKIIFPHKRFKDPETNGSGLTVNDFLGNLTHTKSGRKILIIPPLRNLVKRSDTPFLFNHFMEKIGPKSSEKFLTLPPLTPTFVSTEKEMKTSLEVLSNSRLIACDIETGSKQKITHISFSALEGTFVYEISDLVQLSYIRKILLSDPEKIFQNGRFDALHLIHWGSPIRNWYWDTLGMMQCWYSELPRSLDFIGSFFLENLLYWKDEAESDKALYNAKDTHVTLYSFLAWMKFAPKWAKDNYVMKFPLVFPNISSEFEGIKLDKDQWTALNIQARKDVDESLNSLNKSLGTSTFNPGSPKQVQSLINLVAPKAKIEGSDVKALTKFAYLHPLNALFAGRIKKYREAKKLFSTYIDARFWAERVTYSIDPFGTETGRSAARASSFSEVEINSKGNPKYLHYGIQIQNIPEEFKVCLRADDGFLLVEMDKSQSESRCTAYLSQEEKMIEAVEKSPDFHSFNASAFFGIPFEELWDLKANKTLNKPIRDLSKRVNHGANYNMGEGVLIQTMGEENLWKAKSLLNLPQQYNLKDIAKHLLGSFDKTYKRLRDKQDGWYGELIKEWILSNGLIRTPDGWTRKFFGDPRSNKLHLNALAAHSPQHLSSKLVDDGYFKIWHDLELPQPEIFRVKGQIHDSVLFQVHESRMDLIQKAQEIFDATARIEIHGRELFIPSDTSRPSVFWAEPKFLAPV